MMFDASTVLAAFAEGWVVGLALVALLLLLGRG